MSKINLNDLSLEHWLRLAEAVPLMMKVCEALDNLDRWEDYGLGQRGNRELLSQAQAMAHKALAKLRGAK